MTINANFDELFPSRWLKSSDLPENGKPQPFTVTDLSFEEIGQDRERKLVLHFASTTKCLVCNKTNAAMLVQLVGKDLNNVIGKRIGLYSTPVTYAGKVTQGIRIFQRLAGAPAAPAAPAVQEPEEPELEPMFEPEFGDSEPF